MIGVSIIPIDRVPEYWGDIAPLVNRSVSRSSSIMGLDDVYRDLTAGNTTAWLIHEELAPVAVITTRVMQYPRKRVVHVEHIGGSGINDWMSAAMNELKSYSRHVGATGIEGDGRGAFGRLLSEYGFKEVYKHYEMEIT